MHHLAKADPDFYSQWEERLTNAHEAAVQASHCGKPINSAYGLTNIKEYFAEGVEAYRADADQ